MLNALELAVKNTGILAGEYDLVSGAYTAYSTNAGFCNSGDIIDNALEVFTKQGLIYKDSKKLYRTIIKSMRNGEPYTQGNLHVLNRLGNEFWYRTSFTNVFSEDGKPIRVIICGIDITETKKLESIYLHELENQQAEAEDDYFLRIRVNLSQDLVEDYNAGRLTRISRAGRPYSEEIKKIYKMANNKEERKKLKKFYGREEMLERFKVGETQWTTEYERKLTNKERLWVRVTGKAKSEPETGDVICFFYLQDIDEQKNREMALKLLAANNYDFIGIINVTLGSFDSIHKSGKFAIPDDHVDDYEEKCRAFADEYKKCFSTFEDYIRARELISIENIKEHLETSNTYAFYIKTKPDAVEGEVTYRLSYSYLDFEKKKILMTRTNITDAVVEESERQQMLSAALDEAERANDAKTEFLETINRDIRTPLNAILGFIELSADIKDVDELKLNINKIKQSSQMLINVIDKMVEKDAENVDTSYQYKKAVEDCRVKAGNKLDGKRILLCEDHPLNAEIAIKLLQKKGCIVEHLWNGESCVERMANSSMEIPDVILMDVEMPLLDGIQATKCIRESEIKSAKEIPIIAMTASAYEQDIENCLNAGMNYHLAKPINKEKLYRLIEKAIDKEQ